MDQKKQLNQNPAPGRRMVKFCGDTVVFTLVLPHPQDGTAWVRTNIGQAKVIRKEIFRQVEQDETPLGRAWFDIPMKRIDPQSFKVTLPLWENGHFEAKCFFLPENEMTPIWPQGTQYRDQRRLGRRLLRKHCLQCFCAAIRSERGGCRNPYRLPEARSLVNLTKAVIPSSPHPERFEI